MVSPVPEIPWEPFSCGSSASCHTEIKICRSASVFLSPFFFFFSPLRFTKIIRTRSFYLIEGRLWFGQSLCGADQVALLTAVFVLQLSAADDISDPVIRACLGLSTVKPSQ